MQSATFKVISPLGLHARPCSFIAYIGQRFFSEYEIVFSVKRGSKLSKGDLVEGDAKSVMSLMLGTICFGEELELLSLMPDEKFKTYTDAVSKLYLTLQSNKLNSEESSSPDSYGIIKSSPTVDSNVFELMDRLDKGLKQNQNAKNETAYYVNNISIDIGNFVEDVHGLYAPNKSMADLHSLLAELKIVLESGKIADVDRKQVLTISRELSALAKDQSSTKDNIENAEKLLERLAMLATNSRSLAGTIAPILREIFKWFGI